MLIVWSFNIFIFAVCYLIVGLLKPNWALFWMKEPSRLGPVLISLALIMTAATMYGEGLRNAPISPENVKRAKEKQTDQQFGLSCCVEQSCRRMNLVMTPPTTTLFVNFS